MLPYWYDAIVAFATCVQVGTHVALPSATLTQYANKVLALMRVLARDQAYGSLRTEVERLASLATDIGVFE